jgi:nitronate monooxygenase
MLSRKVKVDFGEELTAQEDEAKAWATIWSAGQGVSSIHDSPSACNLIKNLKIEFKDAIKEQHTLLEIYK